MSLHNGISSDQARHIDQILRSKIPEIPLMGDCVKLRTGAKSRPPLNPISLRGLGLDPGPTATAFGQR